MEGFFFWCALALQIPYSVPQASKVGASKAMRENEDVFLLHRYRTEAASHGLVAFLCVFASLQKEAKYASRA